ncbi:MAG: hypothetical protein JXR83_05735 [Deltaproteobacteria bacterium]|nr:hypothetical protein [Deltaproteobacteria bacterium]
MVRVVCIAVLLASVIACSGEIRCEITCSDTGATVERTFPSCSALRDAYNRGVSGGTMDECHAAALEACIEAQCANSPL